MVRTGEGDYRPPTADERERLHGFPTGHTAGFSEERQKCFIGNTFHTVAVAILLAPWAFEEKYIADIPVHELLWERALTGNKSVKADGAARISKARQYFHSQNRCGEGIRVITPRKPSRSAREYARIEREDAVTPYTYDLHVDLSLIHI